MSALAILMEACTLAHVSEPMAFYALSPHAQGLWLAHAHNKVSGAYYRAEPTAEQRKQTAVESAIAAARARGVLPLTED